MSENQTESEKEQVFAPKDAWRDTSYPGDKTFGEQTKLATYTQWASIVVGLGALAFSAMPVAIGAACIYGLASLYKTLPNHFGRLAANRDAYYALSYDERKGKEPGEVNGWMSLLRGISPLP